MTTPTITPNAPTVKPIAIVYECQPAHGKPARVTVTAVSPLTSGRAPAYACDCRAFSVWGDCQHAEAVRIERKGQGRQ